MKFLLLVLSALFVSHFASIAQLRQNDTCSDYYSRLYQSVQEAYGIDQVLVNGIFYEDSYLGQIGHPFLFENQFYKGTITIKGRTYHGVYLKYDINKQQLVLYINHNNSIIWVIPSNDFVSDFSLEGINFSKFSFQGTPRFYQVIFDSEKIKCLYYWSKSKFDTDQTGKFNKVEFKEDLRKNYLVLEGEYIKFNNNRSFTKSFPIEIRSAIQNYLGSNKIKVVKNSNDIIIELLAFCDSLLKN